MKTNTANDNEKLPQIIIRLANVKKEERIIKATKLEIAMDLLDYLTSIPSTERQKIIEVVKCPELHEAACRKYGWLPRTQAAYDAFFKLMGGGIF